MAGLAGEWSMNTPNGKPQQPRSACADLPILARPLPECENDKIVGAIDGVSDEWGKTDLLGDLAEAPDSASTFISILARNGPSELDADCVALIIAISEWVFLFPDWPAFRGMRNDLSMRLVNTIGIQHAWKSDRCRIAAVYCRSADIETWLASASAVNRHCSIVRVDGLGTPDLRWSWVRKGVPERGDSQHWWSHFRRFAQRNSKLLSSAESDCEVALPW